MSLQSVTDDEQASIEAEQAKAFFKEGNDLNFAGAVVLSLITYAVADLVPAWTWPPALLGLYAVTAARAFNIWQYKRRPDSKSPAQWIRDQTIFGGLAGACWGFANTAMMAHLPLEYQLFILTVAAVSAASRSSSEGFAHHHPSNAYVLASLVPATVWLLTVGDRVHSILAVMLAIFIPVTLSLGKKRNQAFLEAQRMRFRNEALAKELLRQRDVAEHAQVAKTRFLAAASHDLRQPMQAMSIFLELLRQQNHGGRTGELLTLTQQASDAMTTLLNALLDISKLDAGVIKPNRRGFAVQDLLDGMAHEFRPLAERKNLRLRVVPCSATVDSDPVLLGQIVRNMVANALRYTQSGGVLIGCRRGPGALRIEVLDTGIGIAVDQHNAIWGEFYQVGNKERNREQGLGLGLAIVDRIARLLDHPLALHSRPGAGSCFAVTVPRLDQVVLAQMPLAEAPAVGDDLAGRQVVVVEDEASIRTGLQALLQHWGCQVIAAESIAAALKQIGAQLRPIDAVISDMALGGNETGIDAIAVLRARYGSNLPALLITGDTTQAILNAANEANLPMLHKPIRPARLRAALGAAIRSAEEAALEPAAAAAIS